MKIKNLANLTLVSVLALSSASVLAANDSTTTDSSQTNSTMTDPSSTDTTTSPSSSEMNSDTTTSSSSSDTLNSTSHSTSMTNGTATPVDDNTLTQTIKRKILKDKLLSKQNINVSANSGVVSLSGDAKSDTQATLLIMLVGMVPGVNDVDVTQLTVQGKDFPADTGLKAKIKAALMREKIHGVMVDVKDGSVTLTGVVKSQAEADKAESSIKSINGVTDVKSEIKVMNSNNNHSM